MKELKKLLAALNAATELANAADDAYEREPENEEFAEAFDRLYKAEYEARRQLAGAITKFITEIDYSTAFRMTFNPKTADLINRLA